MGIIIGCYVVAIVVALIILFKCYKKNNREETLTHGPRRLRRSNQDLSQYYEF
jgi:uncharacterized MAPEG superfamily protein